MQDQFQGRDDRYGKTIRKNLTLTQEAIEAIEAYAERHNLYFSVAVETLAMMSLGRETAETLPRLTANLLERLMLWQFNRFATPTPSSFGTSAWKKNNFCNGRPR